MLNAFDPAGNPFLKESPDLTVLDTRNVVNVVVAETVHNNENLGKQHYRSFVEVRLQTQSKSLFDPIK